MVTECQTKCCHVIYKNARRKIDTVATGDAAGNDRVTHKSDKPECFTEEQVSWLDTVVGESPLD